MASGHYMELINKQIELIHYSSGGITYSDSENMPANELEYIIYNFKNIKEQEEKNKQEFRKSVFEYANKAIESLFKLLSKLGASRNG